ncbi:MAG: FTR1 family protein [Thermoplasmata archaeon]|nr:FTR1 family protein [Thermoplasmata archaeon]
MRKLVVAQYLLTFREVLEASLLTAIILSYLVMTGRTSMKRYAWYGVGAALGVSLFVGVVILLVYGSLSPANKVLFEGVAALVAVAVLTSMIFWMALQARLLKSRIQGRVEAAATQGALLGVAAVTFVLVFREGLETVLFLTPFLVQDVGGTFLGLALGLGAGLALAYAVFRFGVRLDLRRFFFFTSILLILLAGGLFGYAIHELLEYAAIQGVATGFWGQAAFTLPIAADSLFHHKGAVGSVFAVMFGYTVQPEWARLVGHLTYLAIVLPLVTFTYLRPEAVARLSARWSRFRRSLVVGKRAPNEE